MRESKFQAELIKDLKYLFPGCVVLKNDANYIQGFPDLLVLFEDKWVALEVKADEKSPRQPNQDYYVDMLNVMSYSSYIYPQNKESVLDAIHKTFRA